MAYLAVDKSGTECIYASCPERDNTIGAWFPSYSCIKEPGDEDYVELPAGSIKKLIGVDLTWDDDAVELI